ncbi:MAG: site-specific integrase, partial [Candidatus Latescibacteria bacterium]|nr:site-specific integrase [Candidatus Latescibacterota bacterium]
YYYQDRRYRQKIGTRRKDAEEALSRIKVKIASGEFVTPEERQRQEAFQRQPILFETFALEEFLPWSRAQHSAKHYTRLTSILRVHLFPYFEGMHLHEITPKRIEDYKVMRSQGRCLAGKRTKLVNNATVNRELSCLKVLFRKAVEWGRLEQDPAEKVRIFKETPKAVRLLEEDQVADLLEVMPEHLKGLVACAVFAGLRREELFHLRWEDVNWKDGELNVVSREAHHTKNYESRRIPMNEALVEALRRHPRRLNSPYVFCNQEGNPYDNIRKSLASAAKLAGIEGAMGLHQLRHAFCSHAMMQGIDAHTVQRWMGHRNLTTTLRYAHVSPGHEKTAIQRLQYRSSHQVDTGTGRQ